MHTEGKDMIIRYTKDAGPVSLGNDEQAAESRAGMDNDNSCRCKEASRMSPGALFKLMISDLAFWEKTKKDVHGRIDQLPDIDTEDTDKGV
jgi:hypothetical protein